MILSVLEVHSFIASLFKCDTCIFYFWRVVQFLCIGRVSWFIYNRNRIKVIEMECRCHMDWHPWWNNCCQHGPWTETLYVHGPYWQVISTAGEHRSSVASLTLSDSRAGDNDETSNVDNNWSTSNCVVCLDWWKMYARDLLVILMVLSAVLPPIGTCNKKTDKCYYSNELCFDNCGKHYRGSYCVKESEKCFKCRRDPTYFMG